MSGRPLRDAPASVRHRLLALSKERGMDFQSLLIRYALERLMFRLGRSRHGGRFVLKGALLFEVWSNERFRTTMDMDLLHLGGIGIPELVTTFQEFCREPVGEDGVLFLPESVQAEEIREDQVSGGIRVTLMARLGTAKAPLQVDIGLGDRVTPCPEAALFPTLLGHEAPRLTVYTRETVIAEKLEAMVSLGMPNSRMKDFFDVWVLSRRFAFEGEMLALAIEATFRGRATPVPVESPLALTVRFSGDSLKLTQWDAFLNKGRLSIVPPGFSEVVEDVASFLLLPLRAVARGQLFHSHWAPGGPWEPKIQEQLCP